MSAPPYSGPDEQENQGRVQIPGSGAISSRLIWEPGEIAVGPTPTLRGCRSVGLSVDAATIVSGKGLCELLVG